MKIGCHLSIACGFLSAAKTSISLEGNTFQYFSRNPRGGSKKKWNEKDFLAYMDYLETPNEEDGYKIEICMLKEALV